MIEFDEFGDTHEAAATIGLSARMSDDKTRCVIEVRTPDGVCTIRMSREHAFKLGQTLLLMTGTMVDDGPDGGTP